MSFCFLISHLIYVSLERNNKKNIFLHKIQRTIKSGVANLIYKLLTNTERKSWAEYKHPYMILTYISIVPGFVANFDITPRGRRRTESLFNQEATINRELYFWISICESSQSLTASVRILFVNQILMEFSINWYAFFIFASDSFNKFKIASIG